MSNHPNRSRGNPAQNPTPDEIRELRLSLGITQSKAAVMILATERAWQAWEQGERRMHPGLWQLFLLKTRGPLDNP